MLNLWILLGLFLMFTIGLRLLFEKPFLRKIFGLGLLGHVLNLLLLLSGSTPPQAEVIGGSPFLGKTTFEMMVDPLPQALILTAIVIGFGVMAFLIIFYLISEREPV